MLHFLQRDSHCISSFFRFQFCSSPLAQLHIISIFPVVSCSLTADFCHVRFHLTFARFFIYLYIIPCVRIFLSEHLEFIALRIPIISLVFIMIQYLVLPHFKPYKITVVFLDYQYKLLPVIVQLSTKSLLFTFVKSVNAEATLFASSSTSD